MSQDVIQARRFELVDDSGTVRGILACDRSSGAPTCTLLDGKGVTRVTVGLAWNDMPSIQLSAEDGTARVALIARPEGNGMVLVVDEHGNRNVLEPPTA